MSATEEADVIRRMLDEGHLSRVDDAGHVHELYGTCPNDGVNAPVYRVTRADRRITEVVFRCPSCGHDFVASAERMQLR